MKITDFTDQTDQTNHVDQLASAGGSAWKEARPLPGMYAPAGLKNFFIFTIFQNIFARRGEVLSFWAIDLGPAVSTSK